MEGEEEAEKEENTQTRSQGGGMRVIKGDEQVWEDEETETRKDKVEGDRGSGQKGEGGGGER